MVSSIYQGDNEERYHPSVTGTEKTYSDRRDSEKLFSPELEKINRVADKWLNPRSSTDYAVR